MDQNNDNTSVLWRHGENERFGEKKKQTLKVEFIVKTERFLT